MSMVKSNVEIKERIDIWLEEIRTKIAAEKAMISNKSPENTENDSTNDEIKEAVDNSEELMSSTNS